MNHETYAVWQMYETDNNIPTRVLIINTRTKKIHSSWSDLIEAIKVCGDLNRMIRKGQAV